MSNCPFCNLDPAPFNGPNSAGPDQSEGQRPRALLRRDLAMPSMALPRHAPAANAQMPALRRGLRRFVHRHWHYRLHGEMDSAFNAGVLFDLAFISCRPIRACAAASQPRTSRWPISTILLNASINLRCSITARYRLIVCNLSFLSGRCLRQ